jgi:osmoprotectant transport system ATP-binding protein
LTPQAAIELEGIQVALSGREVLRGVSLTVAAGELVAVVGGSGGGKTTLLRCINRLVEPVAGAVRVLGRDVRSEVPHLLRRSIGYVVQRGGLFPHWPVWRNAEAVVELLEWPPAKRRARAEEVLRWVGLEPSVYRDRLPRELSGGQAQRVALARALAPGPAILLLDEPFGALDPILRRQVRRSLAGVLRSTEAATVLVTHDLREACELGHRVAVLEEGRISQLATPEELRQRPATPFIQELLEDLS